MARNFEDMDVWGRLHAFISWSKRGHTGRLVRRKGEGIRKVFYQRWGTIDYPLYTPGFDSAKRVLSVKVTSGTWEGKVGDIIDSRNSGTFLVRDDETGVVRWLSPKSLELL